MTTTIPNDAIHGLTISAKVMKGIESKTIVNRVANVDYSRKNNQLFKNFYQGMPVVTKVVNPLANGKMCSSTTTPAGIKEYAVEIVDRLDVAEDFCKSVERISVIDIEATRLALFGKALEYKIDQAFIEETRAHALTTGLVAAITDDATFEAAIDALLEINSGLETMDGDNLYLIGNGKIMTHARKYAMRANVGGGFAEKAVTTGKMVSVSGISIYPVSGKTPKTIDKALVEAGGVPFLNDGQFLAGVKNRVDVWIDAEINFERFGNSAVRNGAGNMDLNWSNAVLKSMFYLIDIAPWNANTTFKEL